VELFDGLQAHSQNRWPSLSFDLASINSVCSPMIGAGFYYKTFMWPASFWEKIYEPAIRRAAGLGRAPSGPDSGTYEKANAFCDVLIIGAGPAGLAAALCAGRSGARVILCDEDFVLGGRLNTDRLEIDGKPGIEWARRIEAELADLPEVRILRRTTVFGVYDGNVTGGRCFGALERVSEAAASLRQRMWRIIARRAVLSTGAV
jgi:sarcosine oxidase subunit alpha